MTEIKVLHSLAKVFADRPLDESCVITEAQMLRNDVLSVQIAYRSANPEQRRVFFSLRDDFGGRASLRYVDYVPCDNTMFPGHEALCDHPEPGLFPDILNTKPGVFWEYPRQWRSLWLTVDASEQLLDAGDHELTVIFDDGDKTEVTLPFKVINALIPAQTLPVTVWFHCDCICHYYHVGFCSEEFWRIASEFMKTAVRNGINTLLTPVFTPPLDTEIGGERLTTQLTDVYRDGGVWSFGFEKLSRWIDTALVCGVKYFEISHLFTQWGCRYAPKVMCGGERVFGWETDGHGAEYRDFLEKFLPALRDELIRKGVYDRCFFHISDEPSPEMAEDYKKCSDFVKQFIEEDKVVDALSDIEYYHRGLIKRPAAATDHIAPFIEEKVPLLWAYYCCGQIATTNRFLAFPASRNRVLGILMFKFDIKGFLQWGYNFYNTNLSISTVDPYASSTAGGWVPGGDSYVVYPGSDGKPVESARLSVFADAIRDYRVLTALLSKYTRDEIVRLLGLEDYTFTSFPDDPAVILNVRRKAEELLGGSKTDD